MAEIERVIEGLESIKQLGASGSPAHIKIDEAIQTIRELQSESDEVCEWKLFDEEANAYNTTCGGAFWLNSDGPKDNGFKYCPYCGRKIKVVE